jgi:hypothetical protein
MLGNAKTRDMFWAFSRQVPQMLHFVTGEVRTKVMNVANFRNFQRTGNLFSNRD